MDKVWLQRELEAGRSIESIARKVGRDPSTVAYWMAKHGLSSRRAERHRARGGIPRDALLALVARNLTVREIAAGLGRSYTTVRYWLGRHGLEATTEARSRSARSARRRKGRCEKHGEVEYVQHRDGVICARCRADSVSDWRRRAKRTLVSEAGGRCLLCGHDRNVAALQFHHLDPGQKRFGLGSRGLAQSLDRLREEARKCVVLCANCHAEVEAGAAQIPFEAGAPPPA
jgi:transposase-like protein